jgi:hypothetical protein
MRNLLNPKWLFIINTIPIAILFFIYFGEYNIIKSLLKEENLRLWKIFGISLAVLVVLNFIYTCVLVFKKREVSAWYGVAALLSYIPFLYQYNNYSDDIIPFSIPQWMVPTNMFLYVGTFLMPTIAYSLFVLVTHLTPEEKEHKAWKNFLIAISVPVVWYFFTQIILPFWKPLDANFSTHAIITFIIAGTLIFLFFLIRTIYIIGLKKANVWKKYQLAWKIPISIIFPLLGLAVNNGYLFNNFGIKNSGIFGDFNNHWFYILAVANGIFICLPNLDNKLYRLFLFTGRCLTFAYTFYFFMVFLPFLPLSVIAIIIVGTGFLMLTPLALFIIHVKELSNDYKNLQQHFSKKLIFIISIGSFLVIPFFITTTYLTDKSVLNKTLDYLYNPDYSKEYDIDKVSLSKTLSVVKQHKERSRDFIFGNQIPYLSSYFNWLVLDNLTVSDSKINTIEKVFFGDTSFKFRTENIRNDMVGISKINSTSKFDKAQNAWVSWIDLEITNNSNNNWNAEYATNITLPTGCWISDYYLYVGAKKEMGILAEKKSAMWVFSQIRNENRDPGILYYLAGNKVAFRVFPFVKAETRKTGIEFIHKEPVKINIDSNVVELGNNNEQTQTSLAGTADNNTIYLSAKEKALLKEVQRAPYYHFIVDVSKGKEKLKDKFAERIEELLNKNFISNKNARISFVNTYITTAPLNESWKKNLKDQKSDGGFYLDRAVKSILFNTYKNKSTAYPVIVTVTDSIKYAIIENDFSDMKFTYPESDFFYDLKEKGYLKPHSLFLNPAAALADTVNFTQKVLAYPNEINPTVFLPNNNEASIILKKEFFDIDEKSITEKNWQSALIMQGKWTSQVLHPETSGKEWLNLVKYSFLSKIMTPVTSYLVVENEAQKAILKKKQQQVLSSNKSLDLGEDTLQMSEPNLLILIILLGTIVWFKEKRKRKISKLKEI